MAKNVDFNFEEFAVQAIKAIDEIRSYGKDAATAPIEPRINAFYRAIGLPVAMPQESSQQKLNNGNVFSPNVLRYENNSTSFNIRKFAFKREILPDEIDKFLSFNQNKFSDSIRDESDGEHVRARGVLFPMIVDGEIPIFPQDKRVADAFKTDAELIVGTSKYRRPLIEAIVLMRLKTEGVQNQDLQNKISQDFGAEALQDLSGLTPLISTALTNTIDGLDELLLDTVSKANKARIDTSVNLVPIIANIAQQSLARSEPPEPIGQLDKTKRRQEERLRTQQAVLMALEFDDTFTGDIKNSRNVKDAMLASNLLSVINSGNSNQSKIKKDIQETDKKREKRVSDVKEVFRTLDLLLGTFSGISGVDILVTIMALFKIRINALLGLLNDQAVANLEKIKGRGIARSRLSVTASVNELQQMVTEIFNQIESNVSQTKHKRKRSMQEEGGT